MRQLFITGLLRMHNICWPFLKVCVNGLGMSDCHIHSVFLHKTGHFFFLPRQQPTQPVMSMLMLTLENVPMPCQLSNSH